MPNIGYHSQKTEKEQSKTQEITKNVMIESTLEADPSIKNILQPLELNTQLVEERTRKMFERLNYCFNANGLIDITKLASSFEFEIVEHNGLPELMHGIMTCDSNRKQMAINDNLSKEKKRYTIAYLVSIYLLYYQNQEFFMHKHLEKDENLEASYMARSLLIPAPIFATICPDANGNTQWLADMFQVPCDIMKKRIQEIKKEKNTILTKKIAKSLHIGVKKA